MSKDNKVGKHADVPEAQHGRDVLRSPMPEKGRRAVTNRLFCQFRVRPDLSVEVIWTTEVSK